MGKYIKYCESFFDLAKFVNFDDHSAPDGAGPDTWVAYATNYDSAVHYSTGNNESIKVNTTFTETAYSADTAILSVYPSTFYAEVYDMDDNLLGTADRFMSTNVSLYVGTNDSPVQKEFSVRVQYYHWDDSTWSKAELLSEEIVTGTQNADPNAEPISATARLTIESDGVNPSRIGAWMLAEVASGFTYQYNGSEVDMSNDVYQDDSSMMYLFPSADTYEVNIKYNVTGDTLTFVPNLQNTDANKVYFYTNYPQYAEQVDFSIGGFLADSSAVTEVVLGEGVQKFTGMPWMNLTNLEVLRFLDSNKLPAFQDWQMSWGVPTGVTAYADENADGYDAWTAATANYNWTWINPLAVPLTFEITSAGNIMWNDYNGFEIEYNINNSGWTTISGVTTIPVVSGDTVQFRGDNAAYSGSSTFTGSTCGFKLKGNIMSLVDSTDYATLKDFTEDEVFYGMFTDCQGLTDASELLLPATGLTRGCYNALFEYDAALTTAPELPAATLAPYCYNTLFHGCSSLNYIKCLATDISAADCTSTWVEGVPNSGGGTSSSSSSSSSSSEPFAGGTFVKASTMNDWQFDNANGIPDGWNVVNA